jgi:uncharacterized protein
MRCPEDNTELKLWQEKGIQVSYCPQCRGVWMHQGELERLIERAMEDMGGGQAGPAGYRGGSDYQGGPGGYGNEQGGYENRGEPGGYAGGPDRYPGGPRGRDSRDFEGGGSYGPDGGTWGGRGGPQDMDRGPGSYGGPDEGYGQGPDGPRGGSILDIFKSLADQIRSGR